MLFHSDRCHNREKKTIFKDAHSELNLNTILITIGGNVKELQLFIIYLPFFSRTISNWAGDLKAISWTDVGYSFIISTSIKQVKVGVGVDFKCSICIWKLLLWTHIMQSKELSMQVNQIIKEHSVVAKSTDEKKEQRAHYRCKQGQINLYQNDRKKSMEKAWNISWSKAYNIHLWNMVEQCDGTEHAQLPTTLGLLVFSNDRSNQNNSEVCRDIRSAQIQPNAAK